ncbi:MAG: rhodanese-like domain-containing protein [Weeksellaceae bacterium]|nr:rhodanese-like domain-containing protein [Weeksellaceae bacterium]
MDAIRDPKATWIDVRNEDELENDGKFDRAVHIPLHEIPSRVEDIKNMSKPIVLFCRSGNRSGQAIEYLEQAGVEELYNGGGYQDMLEVSSQHQ